MFEFLSSDQTEWILNKFSDQIDPEAMRVLLPEIHETLMNTLFKWCFSGDKKDEKPKTIFSAILVYLAEKCSIPPHTLVKKYTYRQFSYLLEGIIWNANEQTKDWQFKNKKKLWEMRVAEMKKKMWNNTENQYTDESNQ